MNEKKIAIIQSALKIFATKGFSATSIQAIADDCQISKGSFYLHFKSKEALLISIFEYFYDLKRLELLDIKYSSQSPKDKCLQYIQQEFQDMEKHRDFFLMQVREQVIPYNAEIYHLIIQLKKDTFELAYEMLLALYGKGIKPYLNDLIFIFMGLIDSYVKLVTFGDNHFSWSAIPAFLMRRIDDIATSLMNKQEEPQITYDFMKKLLDNITPKNSSFLLNSLEQLYHSDDLTNDAKASIEILITEFKKPFPRTVILQGMLANIRTEKKLKTIAKEIEIYITSIKNQ